MEVRHCAWKRNPLSFKTHEPLPKEFLAIKEWLANHVQPTSEAEQPQSTEKANEHS